MNPCNALKSVSFIIFFLSYFLNSSSFEHYLFCASRFPRYNFFVICEDWMYFFSPFKIDFLFYTTKGFMLTNIRIKTRWRWIESWIHKSAVSERRKAFCACDKINKQEEKIYKYIHFRFRFEKYSSSMKQKTCCDSRKIRTFALEVLNWLREFYWTP